MEENKTIRMQVKDAIVFCELIGEYREFHEKFMEFLEGVKDPFKTILILGKLSLGERCHASRKIKAFYNAYKKIIDIIEKNAGMQAFSFNNYDYNYGRDKVFFKTDDFYQYLLANVDKKDEILSVLERLRTLGFEEFELNPMWDFSKETFKASFVRGFNDVVYLDNLESIPEYKNGVVKYKTTGSNYKIELRVFSSGVYSRIYARRDRICLNSLTFDADRLPKELSGKEICDEIIGLTAKKQQEYTAIKNSVDLSVGIGDLEYLLNKFNETVTKMESVDSKDRFLEELRNMQQSLNQIQTLSTAYNQSITECSSSITEELLQEEVKKYVIRREESKIDCC